MNRERDQEPDELEAGASALRRDVEHVVFPGLLRLSRAEDGYSLYHPGHGTSLDVEPASAELVSALLDGFAQPCTIETFLHARPDLPEELLSYLIRSFFVVACDELPFLEHGFLRPPSSSPLPLCAWSELPELAQEGAFCLVGVPSDLAALGAGGARQGPSEIRKLLNASLFSAEGDVLDFEFRRLYPAPRPPLLDLGDIDPEGARIDHVGSRIRKVVRELCAHGMRPLLLGGDHSLTHFVLAELIETTPRFGIIHFDAHADMGPSHTVSHANVFTQALESDAVTCILQIGLRMVERVSPFATAAACPKRQFVTARESARGLAQQAIAALPRDIPYYLTFDIDCIDGAIVRETGTPSFGGLSVELASELVDTIAREFELLGADFVEVAASQSGVNAAASIAASLVQRCVLGASPFCALESHVYRF